MKYVRVMDGVKSNAGGFDYKIDEVNISNNWNPDADNPKEMGGFNFCQEDKILRWLHRGNTIYDVIIPEGAEFIEIPHKNCPNGLFRSNQIIVTNPRKITSHMVKELYKISTLPERSYYQCFVTLLFRGYKDVVKYMIEDRINKENVDAAIQEFQEFISKDESGDVKTFQYDSLWEDAKEIYDILKDIQEHNSVE